MQDNSDLIIRDCCEAEAAEFGKPDTICITVDVLREIVQRHSPGPCLHQIQEPAPGQAAPPAMTAALFAARGALQHLREGGKPTESLLNEAIAAIDSVATSEAAPAAVAVPDGWKLVPIVPTEAMLIAIMSEGEEDAARELDQKLLGELMERAGMQQRYANVLAAAPALAATPADHIANAGKMVAAPAGWKLVPVQVPDSAFPWVSGGYSTDYRAHDPRDQKIIEDRAQRTWEAILDGIAATPAAVDYPTEADPATETVVTLEAMEAWHSKPTPAAAAPVVLPEPFALYDGEQWYANEEAAICSCANMQKLQKVYIEQQVRALLAQAATSAAHQAQADARDAERWRELCRLLDIAAAADDMEPAFPGSVHEAFQLGGEETAKAIDAAIAAAKGE